jgi:hypothetical protein
MRSYRPNARRPTVSTITRPPRESRITIVTSLCKTPAKAANGGYPPMHRIITRPLFPRHSAKSPYVPAPQIGRRWSLVARK